MLRLEIIVIPVARSGLDPARGSRLQDANAVYLKGPERYLSIQAVVGVVEEIKFGCLRYDCDDFRVGEIAVFELKDVIPSLFVGGVYFVKDTPIGRNQGYAAGLFAPSSTHSFTVTSWTRPCASLLPPLPTEQSWPGLAAQSLPVEPRELPGDSPLRAV